MEANYQAAVYCYCDDPFGVATGLSKPFTMGWTGWGPPTGVNKLDGDKLDHSHANSNRKTHTECKPAAGTTIINSHW
jgi:hypothetical protein